MLVIGIALAATGVVFIILGAVALFVGGLRMHTAGLLMKRLGGSWTWDFKTSINGDYCIGLNFWPDGKLPRDILDSGLNLAPRVDAGNRALRWYCLNAPLKPVYYRIELVGSTYPHLTPEDGAERTPA